MNEHDKAAFAEMDAELARMDRVLRLDQVGNYLTLVAAACMATTVVGRAVFWFGWICMGASVLLGSYCGYKFRGSRARFHTAAHKLPGPPLLRLVPLEPPPQKPESLN